jgi:hypothetical protein
MALHRRRVYYGYSYSRRSRIENGLSFSIYVTVVIFLLSFVGCLPEIISTIGGWLRSDHGGFSAAGQDSLLITLCEILMTLSGAYLAIALFIRSHTK